MKEQNTRKLNMIDVLLTVDELNVNLDELKADEEEIQTISDQFPKDELVDVSQLEMLATLCSRGWEICNKWTPIIIVVLGVVNSKRIKAKNDAYINAEDSKSSRLTADMRKSISESDPEYNRLTVVCERMKGILQYLTAKKDSFYTFHHFMKNQQKTYHVQGGMSASGSGEELPLKSGYHSSSSTEEDF